MILPKHLGRTVDIGDRVVLWGFGSVSTRRSPEGWRCACGVRAKQTHIYADGDEVCTDCARAFHDANWSPPAPTPPPGQQALSLDPGDQA